LGYFFIFIFLKKTKKYESFFNGPVLLKKIKALTLSTAILSIIQNSKLLKSTTARRLIY